MTKSNKKWTEYDEIKLLNECKGKTTPIGYRMAALLNLEFDRDMTSKSWDKRIRLVRKKYKDAIGVAASFDGMPGVVVEILKDDSFVFTRADVTTTHPRCYDCKHWAFDHHKTDEDHVIFSTVGECRIRSVEDDNFPERCDDECCGEYAKE